MPGVEDPYGGQDWAPPEFPRLRFAMGVVEQTARETRFMGFLHHEEANKRLVNGDVAGAVKHYSKAARFALHGEPGDDAAAGAAAAAGTDPARIVPSFDAPGAEGWALSLLQRAAALWTAGDAEGCVRDCLAVLRVLPSTPIGASIVAGETDVAAVLPTSEEAVAEATVVEPVAEGAGVAAVVAEAQKEKKELSKEEEEKQAAEKEERLRKDRLERIKARATELLGRALAASGQPLAALLALQRCTQARSKRRETALVQFQHLKESLQSALVAEQGESHRLAKVVMGREGATRGVLVATEDIVEGDEILVEEPFLVAPWSTQDLALKVHCAHCLRRLPQPDAGAAKAASLGSSTPQAHSGYCSSICEASAWLLHDHLLSPRAAARLTEPDAQRTGSEEERTSLYVLAERVLACLTYGERESALQPLWSTINAAIRSLPTSEVEAKADGTNEHAELQALVESLRQDVADQSDEAKSSAGSWDASSLVSQLRGGALLVQEQQDVHGGGCRGVGLFLLGSHVGRSTTSTQPNAQAVFSGADSTLRLVALRPISADETITISNHVTSSSA